MIKPSSFLLKLKLVFLLILLWTVPAIGGSPEATPPPECKAAMSLVNLAFLDVNAASKNLDQAIGISGEAIEAMGQVQDSFQKAMKNHREVLREMLDKDKAVPPGRSFPSDRSLKRAQVELEQAQEGERSADSRVQQVQHILDERLATARGRCEVNQ